MTFPCVYRLNRPANLKGRLCRIVQRTLAFCSRNGERLWNDNSEPVALEFEDGHRMMASRSAVILAASRAGKQTIWRMRRGDKAFRPKGYRRSGNEPTRGAEK